MNPLCYKIISWDNLITDGASLPEFRAEKPRRNSLPALPTPPKQQKTPAMPELPVYCGLYKRTKISGVPSLPEENKNPEIEEGSDCHVGM